MIEDLGQAGMQAVDAASLWFTQLFCHHRSRQTRSWVNRLPSGGREVVSWAVCLDCGKHVPPHTPLDQQILHKLLRG